MNRNYMVIRPEITGSEKYTMRMLGGNKIHGLLAFQDKMVNGDVKYYYDITSKQPLSRVLEHRTMSGKEVRILLSELLYMLRQLERFLLDEGQLCLRPECVYVDPSSFKGEFCLVPGMRKEFPLELCELAQYLLDHVDHSDGDAVVLAFSVFKECRKMNFGIEDIERCLRQQERRDEKEDSRKSPASEENAKQTEKVRRETEDVPLDEIGRRMTDVEEYDTSGLAVQDIAFFCAVGIGLAMVAIPVVVVFLFGLEGLYRWKWSVVAGELLMAVVLIIIWKIVVVKGRDDHEKSFAGDKSRKFGKLRTEGLQNQGEEDLDEDEPWEVYFHEAKDSETEQYFGLAEVRSESPYIREQEEDEIQTTLLNVRSMETKFRRLVSMSGGADISIGYFPFLIGKNKDLTDYCLNASGVSRLHMRLDEVDEGYSVTDLNSTNGTRVNGVLLEANETVKLELGDDVAIAGERYIFR